ncbi:MAG: hypothetical protein HYR88_11690 [Verrucomicrobia bacterium]|nr:hypothetical protein [Verrucomicrobiota bacterium]
MFLLIQCVALLAQSACGDSGGICEICGERPPGKMYLMEDRVRGKQVILCERCARLPDTCSVCQIPVFRNYTKLSDGRFLCEYDVKDAVLDQDSALSVYRDAQRDVFSILNGLGVLPDRNISVQLVDQKELSRIFSATPGAHHDLNLQGVTRTRRFSKDSFEHQIFLCLGLTRSRMAAVAAHEYAHTWINENVPRDRVIDGDTVEAFCELTAYELMQQRGDKRELRLIVENAYTRGKIDVLIKATTDYQYHRVAAWMKSGTDETIESHRTERVIALKDAPPPLFGYIPVVHARAPEILRLKGLSGREPRRYALINDITLERGEEAPVKLAEKTLVVRCLDIASNAVILRINGDTNLVRLELDSFPTR